MVVGLQCLHTVELVCFLIHMHLYMNRYVWQPHQSRRHSDPLLGESLDRLSLNAHPRYVFTGVGRGIGATSSGGERLGLPRIPQTPREDPMVSCPPSHNHYTTVLLSLHDTQTDNFSDITTQLHVYSDSPFTVWIL